ncbi:MAG: thioredoxin family protein [Bacteroidia bacterium]|nr:thioredoxin family protein [Bacteroidia bacterium]MDW8236342.1 thioredoxin family protein [Bacteroidia bacterium]
MRYTAATLLVIIGQAQGLERDIQKAFARAKKENKFLWVMVSATWCGPCRVVERKVLKDPSFSEKVKNDYVLLKIYVSSDDHNTPGGEELVQKHRVEAFPTFLYLAPGGDLVYRQVGVPSEVSTGTSEEAVEYFVQKMLSVKRSYGSLAEMQQKFAKGDRTPAFLRSYLKMLVAMDNKESEETRKVFEAYIRTVKSIYEGWVKDDTLYNALIELATSEEKPYRSYALGIVESLAKYLSPFKLMSDYKIILAKDFAAQLGNDEQNWENVYPQIQPYLAKVKATIPFAEEALLSILWGFGYKTTDDMDDNLLRTCLRYGEILMSKQPQDSAEKRYISEEMDMLGWAFYKRVDNKDNLKTALKWMEKSISLNTQNWSAWETMGAIRYKLGQKKEALEALEKAISLAKAHSASEDEYQTALDLYHRLKE